LLWATDVHNYIKYLILTAARRTLFLISMNLEIQLKTKPGVQFTFQFAREREKGRGEISLLYGAFLNYKEEQICITKIITKENAASGKSSTENIPAAALLFCLKVYC